MPEIIAMNEINDGGSNDNEMTSLRQPLGSGEDGRHSELKTIEEREDTVDRRIKRSHVDKVKQLRPTDIQRLKKTSLEKAMEYSYILSRRARNEWLDAEKIQVIGSSLEEFTTSLIDPLKADDNKPKAAIFEEHLQHIAETAVLYEQKKFLCHMVIYNLLMRQWAGIFHGNKYSSLFTIGRFKWFLLNFWTIIDMVVFPVVFIVLYVVHKVITMWKRTREYRVIFILHQSRQQPNSLPIMQDLCSVITDTFRPSSCRFACIIQKGDVVLTMPFARDHKVSLIWQDDVSGMERESISSRDSVGELSACFTKVRELFSDCSENSNKVVMVMSDGQVSHSFQELPPKVKVLAVGVGEHTCIDDLKPLTQNEENITLYNDDSNKTSVCRRLHQCLYGKDIFEYYQDYFTTPFFIFLRDALSYFVLLGLHFAVCLQPSSLHLSVIEWLIMGLFVGRFVMEVDQFIRLKIQLKYTGFSAAAKYFSDPWNRMDALTLVVYVVLLAVRMTAWSLHAAVHENRLLAVSGYMYGLNAMVITLRVFGHTMEANASLGTIQIAFLQIVGSCLAIFGQFLAALVAFSLAITKVYVAEISYKAASNVTSYGICDVHGGFKCWWSLTRYLAWSVFGFGGPDLLQSADDTSDAIAHVLYALFMIMAVVILMNMMIALLSNTYQQVEDNAHYEWSYRKTVAIVTYLTHHPIPVPFNIVSLVYILARHIWRKCVKSKRSASIRLKGKVFKRLIAQLEAEYISTYGNKFSHNYSDNTDGRTVKNMNNEDNLKELMKQTENTRQLIGRLTENEFKQGWDELQQFEREDFKAWDTKGISVVGQRLSYIQCACPSCKNQPSKEHGARNRNSLTRERPGYEILIQRTNRELSIAFGVVDEDYNLHELPGMAGCLLKPGKCAIWSNGNSKDIQGLDILSHDVLGLNILFDQWDGENVRMVFTRNSQSFGETTLKWNGSGQSISFHPFISFDGPGCVDFKVISLHAYSPTTMQFNMVMEKLNDMCSNFSDLQRRFIALDANYSDLQEKYKTLTKDVKNIGENLK